MKTAFINAKIYNTAAERFEDGALLTENGRITGFSGDADVTVDCKGAYMIPGLIDMHTYGRGGYEATDADAEGYIAMAKAYAVAGTTSFMPTMMSVPLQRQTVSCVKSPKRSFLAGMRFASTKSRPITLFVAVSRRRTEPPIAPTFFGVSAPSVSTS